MYYLLDLERSLVDGRMHYWKPNRRGYTIYLPEAGKYSEAEAKEIAESDVDKFTVLIPVESVENLKELENLAKKLSGD